MDKQINERQAMTGDELNRPQWANVSTEQLTRKADELRVRMDELGNAPLYTPQQRHIDAMRAEINRRQD